MPACSFIHRGIWRSMKKLFNNILVPVDFGQLSDSAIKKALIIANHFQCDLHLLHVESKGIVKADQALLQTFSEGEPVNYAEKLEELRNKFGPRLEDGLHLFTALRKGNKEQHIAEYALLQQIDLVIIGRPSGLFPGKLLRPVNINRLSRKTGCPVLSVKASADLEKIRNIVLPVDAHLPIRKIMFASYLAKHFNAKIHLVALTEPYAPTEREELVYLYKTYQLLRDNTNLVVECHPMPGENIADTTLEFARQIDADLIVVNPGKELLLSGFINRLFARFIFNESRIPVMTVAPATHP